MSRIVLLPGMDGSGSLFARFVTHLAPDIEATVVSYPPDRPMDYAELAASVRGSLPTDRPYVLLAESFSGPIAIEVAATRPKGLQGLVLVCTFARPPLRLAKWLHPLVAAAPIQLAPMPLMRAMLFQGGDDAIARQLAVAMAKVPRRVWRSRLMAVLGVDARRRLNDVAVPVLCVRATNDRLLPSSAARAIGAAHPRARMVEMEGPHFLLQTRPDQMAACLRQFIGSL